MTLRTLLQRQHADLALVIGNGINRYGPAGATNSWNDLIRTLAQKRLGPAHSQIPAGISLTEFYDLLDLARPGRAPAASCSRRSAISWNSGNRTTSTATRCAGRSPRKYPS